MLEHNALIGGEESGGYAFRGHVPERDGILANLCLLDLMVRTGKKPTELLQLLFEKVGEHFYSRIDIRLTGHEMKIAAQQTLENINISGRTLGGIPITECITIDGYKFCDGGWRLVAGALLRDRTNDSSLYGDIPEREAGCHPRRRSETANSNGPWRLKHYGRCAPQMFGLP